MFCRFICGLSVCVIFAAASFPAQPYEEITLPVDGTIEGKVTFQGHVPKRKIIPTKNKDICGGIRDEPRIHVSDDKGVQDAIVYLKKVKKGKPWGNFAQQPRIDNKDCRFEPHVQVIRPGAIDIHNSDPILHNTHGFYGRRTAFNLALPKKGLTISKQLKRPGKVRVECDAHGWMLAWVYVADSPYHTITGQQGGFNISNIPPGDYTLVVTQNYLGDVNLPVTVKAGETSRVDIEMKK